MSSPIQAAFNQAEKVLSIDKRTLSAFRDRLKKNNTYLKVDGAPDHFCVGVLVINKKEKKIFVGHHIKSDHWMGAGGHMEEGESPLETVIRECEEELGLVVDSAKMFDLTHFDDVNRADCSQHYDFFYRIDLDSLPAFSVDKGEFHESGWFTFDEVLKKKLLPKYRESLLKLFEEIEGEN